MILVHLPSDLAHQVARLKAQCGRVGFVPTMGALHAGHISLIHQAKQAADAVVASIFVNPTQFNDPADFAKYPITLGSDIRQLAQAGCDLLFLPSVETMYPSGTSLGRPYPLGRLEQLLEGAHRPGHFQGVCQVVDQLLDYVQPNLMVLGKKDYQQCLVLQHLVGWRTQPVELLFGETSRESDGLAMSSRNRRLSDGGRQKAPLIYTTLQKMAQGWKDRIHPQTLMREATQQLEAAGFAPDYAVVAHPSSLELVEDYSAELAPVFLIAAHLDGVRLIDNFALPAHTR